MKELVVLSGKGGTGKTSIVASFATLATGAVLADCDVDAPDLHIMLHPKTRAAGDFRGMGKALVNHKKCIGCGLCAELCRFGAIRMGAASMRASRNPMAPVATVDSMDCEGCGFCIRACPQNAIRLLKEVAGQWIVSDTVCGPLIHARLNAGQENSGKLVAEVKKLARKEAEARGAQMIIVDGPPGIGCPAISSLSGASAVLIVTEPTLSGLHDLERVLALGRQLDVPAYVCINKCTISEENTRHIEAVGQEAGAPILARIPYDPLVSEAIVAGVPVVSRSESIAAYEIERLWSALCLTMAGDSRSGTR